MAMVTFSQFWAHFLANKSRIPARSAASIQREAKDRLRARYAAGRADGVLDFADLAAEIEVLLGGTADKGRPA